METDRDSDHEAKYDETNDLLDSTVEINESAAARSVKEMVGTGIVDLTSPSTPVSKLPRTPLGPIFPKPNFGGTTTKSSRASSPDIFDNDMYDNDMDVDATPQARTGCQESIFSKPKLG